jgi:hypothetical protein
MRHAAPENASFRPCYPWRIIRGAIAIQSETHYLILQLIRLCKRYQAKCLAQNTALKALGYDTPESHAALTPSRIQDIVAKAQNGATEIVQQEFSELEQALLDGTDFLPALRDYLMRNR